MPRKKSDRAMKAAEEAARLQAMPSTKKIASQIEEDSVESDAEQQIKEEEEVKEVDQGTQTATPPPQVEYDPFLPTEEELRAYDEAEEEARKRTQAEYKRSRAERQATAEANERKDNADTMQAILNLLRTIHSRIDTIEQNVGVKVTTLPVTPMSAKDHIPGPSTFFTPTTIRPETNIRVTRPVNTNSVLQASAHSFQPIIAVPALPETIVETVAPMPTAESIKSGDIVVAQRTTARLPAPTFILRERLTNRPKMINSDDRKAAKNTGLPILKKNNNGSLIAWMITADFIRYAGYEPNPGWEPMVIRLMCNSVPEHFKPFINGYLQLQGAQWDDFLGHFYNAFFDANQLSSEQEALNKARQQSNQRVNDFAIYVKSKATNANVVEPRQLGRIFWLGLLPEVITANRASMFHTG